jgi:hypothetical protein
MLKALVFRGFFYAMRRICRRKDIARTFESSSGMPIPFGMKLHYSAFIRQYVELNASISPDWRHTLH